MDYRSMFSSLALSLPWGMLQRSGGKEPGKDLVVVLSDGLWRRRFGGDPL